MPKAEFKKAVKLLTAPDFIGIEKIALSYGLTEQAEILKESRLGYVWNNLRYLGLAIETEDNGAELASELK